jgi:hypothetical protein
MLLPKIATAMETTLITFLQLPLLTDGEERTESIATVVSSDEAFPSLQNAELPATAPDFPSLLDVAIVRLSAPDDAGLVFPDDEIHRDILIPLLPAVLGDAAIREHWSAAGIVNREWIADDFEIPVTASYHASPDARALADTLLAEPSFRELCAVLLNQLRTTPSGATEILPFVEEAIETKPVDPLDALLTRLSEPGGIPLSELLAEPELLARLAGSAGERLSVFVLPA